MIQRIQTVYMLLAIVALALLFVIPYAGVIPNPGEAEISKMIDNKSVVSPLTVQQNAFTLTLTLLAIVTVSVNIFLYRNRPLQINVGRFNLILIAALLISMISVIYQYSQNSFIDQFESFRIGLLLPLIALIFTYMANRRIKYDEELVRSADRFYE